MPRRQRQSKRRAWAGRLHEAFAFALGPVDVDWDQLSELERDEILEHLEDRWELVGAEYVARWQARTPGPRGWAWWAFTAREEMRPLDDELERLLELGEVTEAEVDAIESAALSHLPGSRHST